MGMVLDNTDKSLMPRIIASDNIEEFKFNLNYSIIRNKIYKSEYKNFMKNKIV